MTRKFSVLGVIALGFLGFACQTEGDSVEQPSSELAPLVQPAEGALATVRELVAARGPESPLGDEPAEASFRGLRGLEAKGRRGAGALHVYSLARVEDATTRLFQRATSLGLSPRDRAGNPIAAALIQPERFRGKASIQGELDGRRWHLAYDVTSGAERLEEDDNYHAGFGPIQPAEHPRLLAASRKFAARADAAGMAGAHLYKVRQYKNAVAEGEGTPKEEVYQLAVAYNTTIDGIPVIGSGGKVVVHVGKGEKPVAYETSVRALGARKTSVPVESLITSAEAESRAWAKLASVGLDSSTHKLRSAQFGYYREGRNSYQATLAPTYAFFFDPIVENQKKKIEIIDAVSDATVLKALAEERQQEKSRKGNPNLAPNTR